MKKKFILLFLLFCFKTFSDQQILEYNVQNNFLKTIYHLDNIELNYQGNQPIYYEIKKLKYNIDKNTELYLSFDQEKNNFTDYYRFIINKYFTSTNRSIFNESAYFIGEEKRVELVGNKKSYFQPGKNIGSFTISFWIYPVSFSNNEVILRIGSQYFNHEQNSVEDQSIYARMIDGKLNWEFINIFQTIDTKKDKLLLESYNRILPERWSQINLNYDAYTGIIREYINGIEEGILITSTDGGLNSTLYQLRFHESNRCIITIAPTFYGAIDEFFISKTDQIEKGQIYNVNQGIMISDVIDFGQGGVDIHDFFVNEVNMLNSNIYYYYRNANIPFDKNDNYSKNIKWNLIENHQLSLTNTRFFQWKALFFTGDNNNVSPQLKGIKLAFTPNAPPNKPVGLQVMSINNRVRLKWKMNSESDLKGYKLYYGTKPGHYFGISADEGISPIDIGLKSEYELSGLNPTQIYYFTLTAYDDELHEHESEFSEEISIRPFIK